MNYKIVVDSCCELPGKYKRDERFQIIPLGIEVGDYTIQDDENFDQKTFLEKVASCPSCPKSSCPSPEKFMEAYYCEAEEVFVVTLSSHLSGSYNSAELGRNLYHEKYGEKKIHVVDSESASCRVVFRGNGGEDRSIQAENAYLFCIGQPGDAAQERKTQRR